MSEGSQFTIPRWVRKPKPISPDFEALFNAIPNPAFLIDHQSKQIILPNPAILRTTGYQLPELVGVDIRHIAIDWPEDFLSATNKVALGIDHQIIRLSCHNRTTIDLRLINAAALTDQQGIILFFEPNPGSTLLPNHIKQDKFWEYLLSEVLASQAEDLESALQEILNVGCSLTGTAISAIYTASNQEPEFVQSVTFGDAIWLPIRLPVQDLNHLRTSQEWVKGKRVHSVLHRSAQENQISCLTITPIGQTNAIIGLLIFADRQLIPPISFLPIAKTIAALINSLVQKNILQVEVTRLSHCLNENIFRENTLLKKIKEGVVILNPELNILMMNTAAETTLGYSSQEAKGHPVQDILIGTDILMESLRAIQRGATDYYIGNFRLYRRNGQSFMARLNSLPAKQDSQVNGLIVMIEDLSEEETIRKQTRQLEERAILGEVAAVLAHEVRNPINNISTGLELLSLNMPSGDPNLETITRLHQDCDRLAELMKSVLAYSRTTEYIVEALDLRQFLKAVLDRMHIQIERAGVHSDLQVESDCPPIAGNARALEQVFTNLITNAVQAMQEKGGQLVIKANRTIEPVESKVEVRHYVEISVTDTGPGIPKEMQERIFQPFFTTNQSGTGLGLAISKRIITAHKGTLRLESFPGGTVFHILLPVYE